MDEASESGAVKAQLDAVESLTELAACAGFWSAQLLFTRAVALHLAYRTASTIPDAFARSSRLSHSESHELFERSIRAELAVGQGMTERTVKRTLDIAQLLLEDLPLTRTAVAEGRLLWEACEVICDAAASLPAAARPELDERALDIAVSTNPAQLRRALARMRDELHEEPLSVRHARARQDRAVWVRPEIDGMATLCARLPATAAMGAHHRLDRIARTLRGDGETCSGDERTLAQLRADALTDLLCDGDIAGTTPAGDGPAAPGTFVPGVRAEVRLTLTASTASGADDAPADLDGYGFVPAGTARELVGVGASFTRILTDPDTGSVASVGRTHRVPPARMRLHLQLRDQTCRFPGCTRPASSAEADHTVEWRNGGETSLENLASLCTGHHHVRHGERWTYRLHPDGTAEWTTPTGRRVTTRPAALPGGPPLPPEGASAPPPRPGFEDTPPPF